MRTRGILALVLCFSFINLSCGRGPEVADAPAQAQTSAEVPQAKRVPAPDFALDDLNGKNVRLSSFEGKSPVLLLFWATWCVYCRSEIPKVNQLRGEYTSDELAILAVDIQEPAAKAEAYAERMGMKYDVLLDLKSQAAQLYGVRGVPTIVLIDKNGNAVAVGNQLTGDFIKTVRQVVSE